jgi:hypothetical protein
MGNVNTLPQRGIIGRLAVVIAAFGLLAACGGDDSGATSDDGGAAATTTTTESSGSADLPATVTISAWPDSDFPATGTATVAQDGDDVTLSVTVTTASQPPGYAVLILAGTCEAQAEPPDFSAALDTDTVTGAETKGEVTTTADDLTDGPHLLLVTTPAGEQNLGCGQITT